MTSQSPRIYIYKITFEEVLYYYYGAHKEKKFNEYYMGSPETHKWMWNFYTPKKQILQFFDFTDEGWLETLEVEERLIRPVYNTDKWCLNEACGGKFSLEVSRKNGQKTGQKMYQEKRGWFALTPEERSEMGKKMFEEGIGCFSVPPEERTKISSKIGKKNYELGIGVAGRSKEKMTEDGKKGGTKTKELGTGIFALTKEERIEIGRKSGKKSKELGTGIFALTKEERKIISSNGGKKGGSKGGKKGGKKTYELGVGLYAISPEEKVEICRRGGKAAGKITSSQKWKCLETGFITNPGNLTKYQRKRGIDTSKRVRIS
jgi:general stress protein YciG